MYIIFCIYVIYLFRNRDITIKNALILNIYIYICIFMWSNSCMTACPGCLRWHPAGLARSYSVASWCASSQKSEKQIHYDSNIVLRHSSWLQTDRSSELAMRIRVLSGCVTLFHPHLLLRFVVNNPSLCWIQQSLVVNCSILHATPELSIILEVWFP